MKTTDWVKSKNGTWHAVGRCKVQDSVKYVVERAALKTAELPKPVSTVCARCVP